MLRVTDLTVHYGELMAVDGVDLTLDRDETLALLGRSGSGKTTVLRAIAGLVPVMSGTITLDDKDLGPIPPHQRGIGLVFQDFALFPHLDVGDNVGYGLRMQGATDADGRVEEALAMVGLEGLQRRRVDQLSGGRPSESHWPGRWHPAPGSYCSMSRSARSTRTCAARWPRN